MVKKLDVMTITEIAKKTGYSVVGARKMIRRENIEYWTVALGPHRDMILVPTMDAMKIIDKVKDK